MTLVGPVGLAEGCVRPRHVEDVVDDLEQDAELAREVPDGVHASAGTQQDYALDAGPDQPPRLELVQPAQGRLAALGEALHVDVLPADHAVDAGRRRQLADRREHVARVALLVVGEVAERLGVEPVPGQDRDVLAERAVAGRPAAAQVVVVHRRQVVVDQAVGVDQLERGRERQHAVLVLDRPRRGQREDRADALAAREQAVAHGLLQAGRGRLVGAEGAASPGRTRPPDAGGRGTRGAMTASLTPGGRAARPGRAAGRPARTRRSSSPPASAAMRARSSTRPAAWSAPARPSAARRRCAPGG